MTKGHVSACPDWSRSTVAPSSPPPPTPCATSDVINVPSQTAESDFGGPQISTPL